VGGMKFGVWAALDQRIIDNAVAQWHQCLRASVHAEGGHFEHLLQLNKKTKTTEKCLHKILNIISCKK